MTGALQGALLTALVIIIGAVGGVGVHIVAGAWRRRSYDRRVERLIAACRRRRGSSS